MSHFYNAPIWLPDKTFLKQTLFLSFVLEKVCCYISKCHYSLDIAHSRRQYFREEENKPKGFQKKPLWTLLWHLSIWRLWINGEGLNQRSPDSWASPFSSAYSLPLCTLLLGFAVMFWVKLFMETKKKKYCPTVPKLLEQGYRNQKNLLMKHWPQSEIEIVCYQNYAVTAWHFLQEKRCSLLSWKNGSMNKGVSDWRDEWMHEWDDEWLNKLAAVSLRRKFFALVCSSVIKRYYLKST